MASILHDLVIYGDIEKVFEAVSVPKILDEWWTKRCAGLPETGGEYEFYFAPDCIWEGKVTNFKLNKSIEFTMTKSDDDWLGTKLGFELEQRGNNTKLMFYHSDWKEANEHFRVSSYCWAIYLRILKGYLEKGIKVAYEERDI